MRKHTFHALLFAAALVAVLAMAPSAEACTYECQVGPGFCLQCVDTGSYTGVTCEQSGPCSCIFVDIQCLVAQDDPEFVAEAPAMTPADPAGVAPQPEVFELPAPVAD